jgi:hypothetical protein
MTERELKLRTELTAIMVASPITLQKRSQKSKIR